MNKQATEKKTGNGHNKTAKYPLIRMLLIITISLLFIFFLLVIYFVSPAQI